MFGLFFKCDYLLNNINKLIFWNNMEIKIKFVKNDVIIKIYYISIVGYRCLLYILFIFF